ncbi:19624_t:CDS:2 [Entrophospora sp. SA101]|nr:3417_t:CDS:2 [Entrophospora candida]CAH1763129.1 8624_t:CDS:2 [Entrophospora sp. SA101]CAG8650782.1 12752_t:CDS:2 [Entrophospora candida]CAJ0647854.1 15304_t:CDS:2 [Entrophospora sp. SA101]CAJ0746226.1 19624_t:CDS:2 [Entrophospora sp. SA101]
MKNKVYLKYINQINLKFSPFSPSSKATRIFLARVMNNKLSEENPKIVINTTLLTDVNEEPQISVTYRDGKKLELFPGERNIDEVLQIVGKHLRKLKEKEEFTN